MFSSGAEDFHNTRISIIEGNILALVERESPLHKNIIKRRIADLYKIRIGSRIDEKLDRAINNLIFYRKVKSRGEFLYSINHSRNVLRVYDGVTKRKIDEITPQEIMLAIMECVKNSYSIGEVDLIKETARLFGLQARNKTSFTIRKAIQKMIDNDYLQLKFGKIILGQKME